MNSKVGIVLVNYNTYKDTLECIKSLKQINYNDYEIIVVDNCSTDDSYNKLKSLNSTDFKLIKSFENLGWSGGNNLGIKYCLEQKYEYILLLNNDTLVEPEFLDILIDGIKDKEIGAVGPKILYEEDREKIWFAGGNINWHKFLAENKGNKENDIGQYDSIIETEYITGCAMLIKKDVFEKCGLLPEEYFMYMEDVDFSLRIKEKGYKLFMIPESKIYHKVSASTGGEESPFTIEWMTRNRWLFFKYYKNRSKHNNFISFIHISLANIKNILTFLCKRDSKRLNAILKGGKEGVLCFFRALYKNN